MKKQISEYTYTDLLNDDEFIKDHSILRKNTAKWEKMVLCGKLNREEYLKACKLAGCYSILVSDDDFNIDKTWDKINMAKRANKTRHLGVFVAGAAAAILLMIGGWGVLSVLNEGIGNTIPHGIAAVERPILDEESKEIQLIVDNQQKYTLENNASVDYTQSKTTGINSNPVASNNNNNASGEKEISYNQLVVPKGKRSQLILEDGSKVWVNAGSRVVYPVAFGKAEREIYIEGEVFLDVTKDAQRPFVVKTKELNIKVLGTSFNVKSQLNNSAKEITLVTGKVMVEDMHKKEYVLNPSQQLKYADESSIVEHVDTDKYTCWRSGVMRFDSERLTLILQKLSDYYGITIHHTSEIEAITCSGSLDLSEDFTQVIKSLGIVTGLKYKLNSDNSYEVE